jgi:hypothetical protein
MNLRRLAIAAILIPILGWAPPALARGHGGGFHGGVGHFGHAPFFRPHGGAFFRGGVFVGPGFYGYPYSAGYPYYYGAPYYGAPYYGGTTWGYWCDAYQNYYPNVATCPTGWRYVPVQ